MLDEYFKLSPKEGMYYEILLALTSNAHLMASLKERPDEICDIAIHLGDTLLNRLQLRRESK